RADLVDLVEEHDAVVLDAAHRILYDAVLIDELVALLGNEQIVGLADRGAARLGARAEGFAHDLIEIDHADLTAGDAEGGNLRAGFRDLDVDLLLVELIGSQLAAKAFARRR